MATLAKGEPGDGRGADHKNGEQNAAEGDALRDGAHEIAPRLLEGGPDDVLAGVVGHERLRLVKIDPNRAEADAILQPAKPALVQLDLRSHSGQLPFRLHDIGEFSGAALKQRDKALLEPSGI